MSFILSICIPTYNRASCLFECLTSIFEAISGNESRIEIIISDNASSDNTSEVVKAFTNNNKLIRYHRNHENIGGEKNFRLVTSLAEGQYVWVFGDDDKIEKDAIQVLLPNLLHGYEIIICNYSVWTKDFTWKLKTSGLKELKDEVITDKNQLLATFHTNLGYITSLVFQKNLLLHLNSSEYERYSDYGFSFMYAIYVGFAREGSTAKGIPKSIFMNRSDNLGNFNPYKLFAVGVALVCDNLLAHGYSESAVSRAKHQNLVNFILPNTVGFSLRSDYDRFQTLKWMFIYYRRYIEFWALFLPMWSIPIFLIKGLKNAAKLWDRFKSSLILNP
jgi:abequosyltransferase